MIITRILRTMKRTAVTATARILRKTILRTAPAAMHRTARRITATNNKSGAVIWLYRFYYCQLLLLTGKELDFTISLWKK